MIVHNSYQWGLRYVVIFIPTANSYHPRRLNTLVQNEEKEAKFGKKFNEIEDHKVDGQTASALVYVIYLY